MRLKLLRARAAAWRAIIDATHGVPLPWMLDALRVMRRVVPRRVSDWAEPAIEVLGLVGDAALDYSQRAWWSAQASKAVQARLLRRPDEVMAALGGAAPAIHEARDDGRGLLVLGAHLGPGWVAATWLRDHYPDTLFVIAVDWGSHGHARVARVGRGDARQSALVQALHELARGGVVYVAPDGPIGQLTHELPLRGRMLPMASGAPSLARLAQVPAIPLIAAWRGDQIELMCARAIAPPPKARGAEAQEGERAWLAAYLDVVDTWQSALGPENQKIGTSLMVSLGKRGRPIAG